MSIAGVIAAALRQEAPYAAEIQMSAKLLLDFQGARTGGRPYYWYRGTRYTSPEKIPGWMFSRASGGYQTTRDGRMVWFPAGAPRITDAGILLEDAATNLVKQSRALGTAPWTQNNSPTITNNAGVLPDGSLSATRIQTPGGPGGVFQFGLGGTSGAVHAVSYLLKDNGGLNKTVTIGVGPTFFVGGTGGDRAATFNLQTGALSAVNAAFTSTEVIPLVSGWWLVTLIFTALTVGSANSALFVYGGAANTDFLVADVQLEVGGKASSRITTTTTAATRAADSAAITGLGLILGEFRTNLLTWSNDFTNAAWVKGAIGTATLPVLTPGFSDPLGGAAATRIVFNRGAGTSSSDRSSIEQIFGSTAQLAASVWLRADAPTTLVLRNPANNGGYTIANVTTAWQLFEASGIPAAAANFQLGLRGDLTANATATVYVYEAQGEPGSVATARINTTTAPVTVGNPFTLQVWADFNAVVGVSQRLASANDGTLNFGVQVAKTSGGGQTVGQASAPGSIVTSSGPASSGNVIRKTAIRQRAGDYMFASDGVGYGPNIIQGPPGLNRLDLGSQVGIAPLNGSIQRVAIYGDVTDAQLTRLAA